jgi:hypothetical protein
MSGDQQFVERAVFEKDRFPTRVGQWGAGVLGVRNLHEYRMVDAPGVPIDQRLDGGQAAAVVPAAGIRTSGDNGKTNGKEQDASLHPSLSPPR